MPLCSRAMVLITCDGELTMNGSIQPILADSSQSMSAAMSMNYLKKVTRLPALFTDDRNRACSGETAAVSRLLLIMVDLLPYHIEIILEFGTVAPGKRRIANSELYPVNRPQPGRAG